MDPSISRVLLFWGAAGAGVLSVLWSTLRLKRLEAGPERDELAHSLWGRSALATLLLALAAASPPLSLPPTATLSMALVGAVLFLVGRLRGNRLATARRLELERAEATADNLADRVAALEARRPPHRPLPYRTHLAVVAVLVLYAGPLLDTALAYDIGVATAVGSLWPVALLALWYGHFVYRRKTERLRIDREVQALLGGLEIGRAEERRRNDSRSGDDGPRDTTG